MSPDRFDWGPGERVPLPLAVQALITGQKGSSVAVAPGPGLCLAQPPPSHRTRSTSPHGHPNGLAEACR